MTKFAVIILASLLAGSAWAQSSGAIVVAEAEQAAPQSEGAKDKSADAGQEKAEGADAAKPEEGGKEKKKTGGAEPDCN